MATQLVNRRVKIYRLYLFTYFFGGGRGVVPILMLCTY